MPAARGRTTSCSSARGGSPTSAAIPGRCGATRSPTSRRDEAEAVRVIEAGDREYRLVHGELGLARRRAGRRPGRCPGRGDDARDPRGARIGGVLPERSGERRGPRPPAATFDVWLEAEAGAEASEPRDRPATVRTGPGRSPWRSAASTRVRSSSTAGSPAMRGRSSPSPRRSGRSSPTGRSPIAIGRWSGRTRGRSAASN